METVNPSEDEEESAKKPKGSKKKASASLTEDGVLHPLKLSKGELYKAPTVEELNKLKEAESLFHCSLLKMQVSTDSRCLRLSCFVRSWIRRKNTYLQKKKKMNFFECGPSLKSQLPLVTFWFRNSQKV